MCMKLSLCMIVKNEGKYIGKCLESIKDKVDEIIIVDTGSTDNTKIIAGEYTSCVLDFAWCDDFSAARNYSVENASNDWILVMDADEICTDFNKETVSEFLRKSEAAIGRIKIINYYGNNSAIQKSSIRLGRLFNRNLYIYNGSIHEQLEGRSGNNFNALNIDITLEHFGYTEGIITEKSKIKRNEQILLKALEKSPEDPYMLYQLGKIYFIGKRFYKSLHYLRKSIQYVEDLTLEYAEDLIESYGYSLLNTKKYKEALIIKKYENVYNELTDFSFLMGLIYMNNGHFDSAKECFQKCLVKGEGKIEGINSFLPIYNLGVIYECLGEKKRAVELYRSCGSYELAIKRLKSLDMRY